METSATTASSTAITTAANADPLAQECFVAGEEAFEALTERAATAPRPRLIADSASAVAKAQACQRFLAQPQSAALTEIIGRIGQFQTNYDRTALALAAVEGYRVLVSARERTARDIPLEVSLLDYAGFRYQAGARSTPPLWEDMRQAVDFADAQWRTISARVADARLKASFAADLATMRAALDASNPVRAQRAATSELDHVDALERYFSPHPPG